MHQSSSAGGALITPSIILRRSKKFVHVSFPNIGFLYDVLVHVSSIAFATLTIPDASHELIRILQLEENERQKSNESDAPPPAPPLLLLSSPSSLSSLSFSDRQAAMFISMIVEVRNSSINLIADAGPSVLGLRLSMQQGWKPAKLPPELVDVLISLLDPSFGGSHSAVSSSKDLKTRTR